MGKFAKSISGIVLLCIIGGAIFLFLLWSRMPDMVASHLAKRLKVGVEIGDMTLSMDAIGVDRFDIHNPAGYKLPKAFSAEKITIEAPLTSYLHDNIVIEEIDVNNVYIGLEFDNPKSTTGNWSTILNNAESAKEESSKSASNKTVLIKRLLLTNIQAELLYQSDGKVRKLKTIKQIELKNISSQGGNIGDQLMNSALGEAVKEIFVQENLKDILDKLMNVPGNPLNDYLGPIKGIFNAAPPMEANTEEAIACAEND
jgi:uncharacterized protein involved in outer membrane biogenesis